MTLRMADRTRQWLQQKMSLGYMEEKTIVETANPLGSPKNPKTTTHHQK